MAKRLLRQDARHCWQDAAGLPPCVRKTFANSGLPFLSGAEVLLAIPEHKVDLPGGRRPSQNDLFVLARSPDGLVTIMVEGKVQEAFGPLVSEWLKDASDGKQERLKFLIDTLGIPGVDLSAIRYQLLHRTVSAILEAKRYFAKRAVMLVHSFSPEKAWFDDYARFAALLGVNARSDSVQAGGIRGGIELYVGWVCGDPAFLKR